MMETDRPFVLRQALQAIRKGGTLSIPGVYGGVLDKINFGAAFGKGIHMNMGQTHMHRYLKPLLERVEKGQIDPSFMISDRIGITAGARPTTKNGRPRKMASPRSSSIPGSTRSPIPAPR